MPVQFPVLPALAQILPLGLSGCQAVPRLFPDVFPVTLDGGECLEPELTVLSAGLEVAEEEDGEDSLSIIGKILD